MSALATVRASRLDSYLELLEARLERSVRSHPGLVAEIGPKRCPPGANACDLCSSSCTPAATEPASAPWPAVRPSSSCTWPRSSTTTSSTQISVVGGRPWAEHGAGAAKAAGDYLRAGVRRAGEHRRRPRGRGPGRSGPGARARRGASATPGNQPDTTVDEYLTRCSLKTGKLFEAACVLGGGRRARRLRARARGRLPDRGRHPRLHRRLRHDRQGSGSRPSRRDADPAVILAARADEGVRRALAGEPVDGRWNASPAPARSRPPAATPSSTRPGHAPPSTASRTARPWRLYPSGWIETIDGHRHAAIRSTPSGRRWRPTSASTSRTGSSSWSPTTSSSSASWPTRPAESEAAPTRSTSSRTCT